MTQEHPITPPPHLLKAWMQDARDAEKNGKGFAKTFAMAAIKWALTRPRSKTALYSEHPITPPSELYRQWESMPRSLAFEAAYRAGADQELEACCEWVGSISGKYGPRLRLARRPKPPSLKEQALNALDEERAEMSIVNYNTIRAVLESLPS